VTLPRPEPPPAPSSPRRALGWTIGVLLALAVAAIVWVTVIGRTQRTAPPPRVVATPPPMHHPVAPPDTVAAAAPSPEPAPVTEPKAPAPRPTSGFVVQVGAFRSERNARATLRQLVAVEPEGRIEARGGLSFVISRTFASEREARALEQRLKGAGLATWVRPWKSP